MHSRPHWPAAVGPKSLGASALVHGTLAACALGLTVLSAAPGAMRGTPHERSTVNIVLAQAEPRPEAPAPAATEPVRPLEERAESELPELVPREPVEEPWPEDEPPTLRDVDAEAGLEALPLDVVLARRAPEPEPPPDPPLTEPEPALPDPSAPHGRATVDTSPQPLPGSSPRPPYPVRAVRQNLEGAVVCLVTVAADGTVEAAEVTESSGHSILDNAARETLLTWRFAPGTRDGVAVRMDASKRFLFRLND